MRGAALRCRRLHGWHVEELGPRLVHRSPASHLCAVTVWVRRHSSSRGRWRASRLTHATLAFGRGSTCVDQWSLLLTLMSSSLRLFPGGQHCEGSHAVHIHFLCPARRWRQSVRLRTGRENVCAECQDPSCSVYVQNLSGREATATQGPPRHSARNGSQVSSCDLDAAWTPDLRPRKCRSVGKLHGLYFNRRSRAADAACPNIRQVYHVWHCCRLAAQCWSCRAGRDRVSQTAACCWDDF